MLRLFTTIVIHSHSLSQHFLPSIRPSPVLGQTEPLHGVVAYLGIRSRWWWCRVRVAREFHLEKSLTLRRLRGHEAETGSTDDHSAGLHRGIGGRRREDHGTWLRDKWKLTISTAIRWMWLLEHALRPNLPSPACIHPTKQKPNTRRRGGNYN